MTSVVSVASSVASSGTFSSVVLVALRHDDDQRGLTGMATVVSACQSAGLNMALRGCGLKWHSDTSDWHHKAWSQRASQHDQCGLRVLLTRLRRGQNCHPSLACQCDPPQPSSTS